MILINRKALQLGCGNKKNTLHICCSQSPQFRAIELVSYTGNLTCIRLCLPFLTVLMQCLDKLFPPIHNIPISSAADSIWAKLGTNLLLVFCNA